MVDIKLILEKPDYVVASLKKKLWDFDPKPIIDLSARRLELLKKVEASKAEQKRRGRRQSDLRFRQGPCRPNEGRRGGIEEDRSGNPLPRRSPSEFAG